MTTHRIGWAPSSVAELARKLLAERTGQWLAAWPMHGCRTDIEVVQRDFEQESGSSASGLLVTHAAGGQFFASFPEMQPDAVGALLLDLKSIDAAGLCEEVGTAGMRALVLALAAMPASTADEAASPSGVSLRSARAGALHLEVTIGPIRVRCMADSAWWSTLIPYEPASLHLLARTEALRQQNASLSATVELGHVSLAEISGLQAGEILLVEGTTDQVVRLSIGGHVLGAGALVAAGDQRAVKLFQIHHRG